MRTFPPSLRDFNSIKVRLKLLACLLDGVDNLFQFHKGTIKTDGAHLEEGLCRVISIP